MWLPLDRAVRARSSALLGTLPSSETTSLKVKPGALMRPVPALTWSKTYSNPFWTATEDDANGPVNGPISVTVIVWGVEGAAAAVVAVEPAVVAVAAAVVAVALLLLLSALARAAARRDRDQAGDDERRANPGTCTVPALRDR